VTIPTNDYDPHELDRLKDVIVQMVRALPAERRRVVHATVKAEPFTFWGRNVEPGWFEIWVGEKNPTIVGKCHIGALRRDDASAN
jgi:hypothetical protein